MAIKETRTIRINFTATTYTLVRVETGEVAFTRNLADLYLGVTLSVTANMLAFRSSGLLDQSTRPANIQGTSGTKSFTALATGRVGEIS